MPNVHKEKIQLSTVLFDLDGTLYDTAPDLAFALNQLCLAHHAPALAFKDIRPHAGHGSHSLLKLALNIDTTHPTFQQRYEQFITLYQSHISKTTQLFTGVKQVLTYLEEHAIPWGIVTNKPQNLTDQLLSMVPLPYKPHCLIYGNSLPKRKPFPDPILYACQLLKKNPYHCLYIGDTEIDVLASKAAGTQSMVALYGYISQSEDPYSWQADGYIKHPIDIITWLQSVVTPRSFC
ncbi:MAG: hypothetical protein A3E83_08020 [Gammaproteobacteria bacterium RIFCSPHIGHO2_12_FULL_41_20]|nr:MAG: hypothetical protein A3E83_08020 [Gammaproteobacteria bacterium RIFCSPHIGHO2_12_FULL_41_20]